MPRAILPRGHTLAGMSTRHPARYAALALAVVLAGCGGGDPSPTDAVKLLLDQGGECYAVAAGRVPPAKFNAAAADIASVPMAQVCAAWPAGLAIDCPAAYAALSKPFTDAKQCSAGSVTP